MVPTETSASSCDGSLKLRQMEIVTYTHVLLKVVELQSKENDRIKQNMFKLSCIYS